MQQPGFSVMQAPDGMPFVYADEPGVREFLESVLLGRDYPALFPGLFEAQTIVDVGAHAGAAARWFTQLYPNAAIHCFEPNPVTFRVLCENVKALPNVRTENAGLAAESGSAQLHLGRWSSMQASMIPNEENTAESFTVHVLAADAALRDRSIERISILKVDTEGLELPILHALAPWLARTDVVFLEYHSDADRLALDALLAPRFALVHARANEADRGANAYMARTTLAALQARTRERYVFAKSSDRAVPIRAAARASLPMPA
jgi:FkbM family methyltransferase